MPEGFWLNDTQWERLAPLLPNKPRGVARVGDRRVISGTIVARQSGGRRIDVPAEHGPRPKRWPRTPAGFRADQQPELSWHSSAAK